MSYIWTDSSGRIELAFTATEIDPVPQSGAVDDAIAELLETRRAELQKLDLEQLRECVNEYGTELEDDADADTVYSYLLWLAVLDIKEDPERHIN